MKNTKKIVLLFVGVLAFLSQSCKSISYEDMSGRKITVSVLGLDTSIGSFAGKMPDGSQLTFTNLNSSVDPTLAQSLNSAINKIPNAATLPIVP